MIARTRARVQSRNARRVPRKRAPDVEPAVELALLLPGHFSPHAHKPAPRERRIYRAGALYFGKMLNFHASNLHLEIYDHDRGTDLNFTQL